MSAEFVELPEPKFDYFVSYFYELHDGYTGYGMTNITSKVPILKYADVVKVADFLTRNNAKYKSVIIQNWKQLES